MSQYQQVTLKPYGVVSDPSPFNVENEWTSVKNMRFNDRSAEKMGGELKAVDTTQEPYFVQFNGDHNAPKWFYMGDGGIYSHDFVTEVDLDTGNLVSNGRNWDSTLFNSIPVMNNTVDAPWAWLGGDVIPLPAFPPNTTCKSIKPYRSFLVSLNITDNGDNQENRIIWSDVSDSGALPASWDIADPTKLAGDAYLTSSKGEIIDGLQLRDLFVIYKTHATYIMRLIQGQEVMRIEKIQINSGILAKNCVQEFKGIHFIVSDGDVVLFDGQTVKSIADQRVRSTIFDSMDNQFYQNTYVSRFDRNDEMWVCYPTSGSEYPNQAAIWNWKDDTWTFRELLDARHIASGQAILSGLTYEQATFTYASDEAKRPYSPLSDNPTTDTLLVASSLRLGVLDESFDFISSPMTTQLEKVTMELGTNNVKIVNSVTPRITASAGAIVYIRIGVQFNPDDEITWATERPFKVGIDREAHFHEKGRYISVRFRTHDSAISWKLHSFDIEIAKGGKY